MPRNEDRDSDSRPTRPDKDWAPDPVSERRGADIVRKLFEAVDRIEDKEVRELVREDLARALCRPGNEPLGERMMEAYRHSIEQRVGRTQDPRLRDAEYFMLGMAVAVQRDHLLTFFTLGTGHGYEIAKDVAHFLEDLGHPGFERWLRADKNEPTLRGGSGAAMGRAGYWAGFGFDRDQRIQGSAPVCGTPDMGRPRMP